MRKARRKKIALISVELANKHSGDVRLLLRAATLIAGERRYNVERRAIIIRKLSEFTWDFLLYMVLDFQPVLAAVDILCFLTGPLHNRRLGKQLSALSDGELLLKPGERRKDLAGFPGCA